MKSVLKFYRQVYEQELSQAKRLHIHSGRFIKRYFISKKEELLTDEYPKIPILDKHGDEIYVTTELKGNEVDLKYFSGLRISRFVSLNKYESTRAYPLFSYDAKLEITKEGSFVSVDLNSRTILKSNFPSAISSDPEFKKIMLLELTELSFYAKLQKIVERHCPEEDSDELLMYPDLWSLKKINAQAKLPFKEGDKYVPAGILGLVERENDSYTTLDELRTLESADTFSGPINAIFSAQANYKDEALGILCEELNSSQLIGIQNSNERVLSVVSGPPGTGKSFMIANLAAEKVSKGQSVLVTSKNKEALRVIEEKIKNQLKIDNLTINPTEDSQLLGLKKHLDYLLGRKYSATSLHFEFVEEKYAHFETLQGKHLKYEKELQKSLELEKNLIKKYLGTGYAAESSMVFKDRVIRSREKYTIPLWDQLQTYYSGIDATRAYGRKVIREVNKFLIDSAIHKNRAELRTYQKFLRAKMDYKKEKEDLVQFDVVLKAFPVWLVQANQISKTVELGKEMFDILIIDEASQCDIPSILPLMQRAKKCIIVGDSNQLSHISFVSRSFEAACQREVNESFRALCNHTSKSILDLGQEVVDPMANVLLNEHFRSKHPIISFSNRQFYNDELNIMTKRPLSTNKHVRFVPTKGKRIKGVNGLEIEKIVARIRKVITDEKELKKELKSSIGVLSPFRKQIDAIFNAVRDNFTLTEIKNHHIMVGTAFSFQGNERDLMLLSFSLDRKSVGGSFTFINRADVFNVSVTRAKSEQIIYYSFDEKQLNPDSTLASFFRHYELEHKNEVGLDTKDEFCHEVIAALQKFNATHWTKFDVSGVQIDLLVQINEKYLGIDLIGFPGELEDYYSLERYKMLERGGVPLFPLPYALWRSNKEKCIQAIQDIVEA